MYEPCFCGVLVDNLNTPTALLPKWLRGAFVHVILTDSGFPVSNNFLIRFHVKKFS